jgi:D-alanine-D-alanine ligase
MNGSESPLCIAVLFGGQSGEHEVSLESAKSLLKVLALKGYTIRTIGISPQGQWFWGVTPEQIQQQGFPPDGKKVTLLLDPTQSRFLAVDGQKLEEDGRIDLIFPVLHGSYGEDGTLQGLCEIAGVPYVGSGVLGSALGMDKDRMKAVFSQAGLAVAPYVSFLRSETQRDAEVVIRLIEEKIKYPCFVKPANMGSSVGITKAHQRDELARALATAAVYDRKIIVEQNIAGREIEVSVLGNDQPRASLPGEILPTREFYDYEAKYLDQTSRLLLPAPLKPETVSKLQQAALTAFQAVEACGLARVDFFVTEDETVIINEINTMPGFTDISMYPKLWEISGLSYELLVEELIKFALERHTEQRNRGIKR